MKRDEVLLTIASLLFAVGLYLAVRDPQLHADEAIHYNQILRFVNGNPEWEPHLTTFPTYHYLLSLPARIFPTAATIPYLRFFAFCLSGIAILFFYGSAQWMDISTPMVRTFQFSFLPIIFPLLFLIYTDVFSLAFVVLAICLAINGRYTLAGIVGAAAILTRQNNAIWLVLCCVFIFERERGIMLTLKKGWFFVLLLCAFGVFVVWNHGIALGDVEKHPWGIYTGNIFFMLLLFFFVFLPLNIQCSGEILNFVKGHKLSWILIPALYAIYLFTFRPTHPYNQAPYAFFLRNRLLLLMNSSVLWKSFFFIPMIYTVLTLIVTKLRRREYYWIYPASVLSVLPSWLIEQRYYLIPFSLFLLMRDEATQTAETLQIVLYMPAALFLLYGITSGGFFL